MLSECYRLRWRIEQAFDQPEQKLEERQAWGKSNTVKTIPASVLCPAHNLLQIFHATLKTEAAIEDTKVIIAYHKDLDRREAKAKASGRAFPKALYQALYRPTELSRQFLRWYGITSYARPAAGQPSPSYAPYGAILIGISWTGFGPPTTKAPPFPASPSLSDSSPTYRATHNRLLGHDSGAEQLHSHKGKSVTAKVLVEVTPGPVTTRARVRKTVPIAAPGRRFER